MPAILDCKLDRRWNINLNCDCNGATVARVAAATVTVKHLSKPSRSRHPAQCCIRHLRRRVDPEQVAGSAGRHRPLHGNSDGARVLREWWRKTREQRDSAAARCAGGIRGHHLGRGGSEHRCRRRAPEASQTGVARGDTAGGEERGAEPHLYISRDEAWHGTVACACVGATRAHAATYPRMQQRRVSLHVFNKPQATPHSVQAGTMHVAAITSAADELPSPRRGAPDRTERTQPFIVHLRFVQMQRAHRQPCGRCVSQHAAQLVRSVMHTLLYCQGRELPRPPNILRSKFERSDSATHSELEVIIV